MLRVKDARSLPRAAPHRCHRSNSTILEKRAWGGKTHPFFVVYCPVKRASAPSILTQWSFQMLKGGEGVVGGVGWGGGGVGGGGWLGVRNRLGEPITTQRWRKNTTVRGGGGVGWDEVGGGCSGGGCPGSALRQAAHALPTAGPYPTYRGFLSNLLILKSPRVRGTVNVPAGKSISSFTTGKETWHPSVWLHTQRNDETRRRLWKSSRIPTFCYSCNTKPMQTGLRETSCFTVVTENWTLQGSLFCFILPQNPRVLATADLKSENSWKRVELIGISATWWQQRRVLLRDHSRSSRVSTLSIYSRNRVLHVTKGGWLKHRVLKWKLYWHSRIQILRIRNINCQYPPKVQTQVRKQW